MPRARSTRRTRDPSGPDDDRRLTEIGLRRGEHVRFRRDPTKSWVAAIVTGRERDGSVGLIDERGRSRAIPIEAIEVRVHGPRGGEHWEPLNARRARPEQLRLL